MPTKGKDEHQLIDSDDLLESLEDKDLLVRKATAWILGHIRETRAASALERSLEDAEEEVREAAAKALGEIRSTTSIPALVKALSDKRDVREAAAFALGTIGEPAVEDLLRALKDNNKNVRSCAAEALGVIGEPSIISLAPLLTNRNESIRRAAADVLEEIERGEELEGFIDKIFELLGDVKPVIVDAAGFSREVVLMIGQKLKDIAKKNPKILLSALLILLEILSQPWNPYNKPFKYIRESLKKLKK